MSGIGIFGAGIFSAGIFNNGVLGAPGGAGTPVAIKYNPGCLPCCDAPVCQILQDYFDYPSSISNYTITDPSSVYFDVDNITIIGPDHRAVTIAQHNEDTYSAIVYATVLGQDGTKIRLLISYDVDNGLIMELTTTLGCGELRMFKLENGVETLLGGLWSVPGAVSGVKHEMHVCYNSETKYLTGYVLPGGPDQVVTQHTVNVPSHIDHEFAGMESSNGIAKFFKFTFNKLWITDVDGTRVWCGKCGSDNCKFFDPKMYGDDVSCDFRGDVGDWSVATGHLESLTPLTEIWSETPYPDNVSLNGKRGYFVRFTFMAAEAGRVLQIRFNSNAENTLWHAVEITTGFGINGTCGKLRLIDQDGNSIVEDHIVYGVVPGTWFNCSLAYDDGQIFALVWNSNASLVHVIATDPEIDIPFNGGYVGIALVGGSGSLKFYEIYGIQKIENKCLWPEIPWCKVSEGWFGSFGSEVEWPDNYSIEFGTPVISSTLYGGRVTFTDDSMIHRLAPVPAHTLNDYKVKCHISRKGYVVGSGKSSAGVIVGSDGSGNNHYEVRVSQVPGNDQYETYELGIYRIENGIESLLTYDLTSLIYKIDSPDTDLAGANYAVCWNNGTIECTMYFNTLNNNAYWARVSYGGLVAYGNYVGQTAKPVTECVSSHVELYAPRRVDEVNPDLNPCEPCAGMCTMCIDDKAPLEIVVELRGWIGCACTSCDESVNRDFYVRFEPTEDGFCAWRDTLDTPGDCLYRDPYGEPPPDFNSTVGVGVQISLEDGVYVIYGTVSPKLSTGGGGSFQFKITTNVNEGERFDCFTYLDGLELDYIGEVSGCGNPPYWEDGFCTPQIRFQGEPDGPITGTFMIRVVQ